MFTTHNKHPSLSKNTLSGVQLIIVMTRCFYVYVVAYWSNERAHTQSDILVPMWLRSAMSFSCYTINKAAKNL